MYTFNSYRIFRYSEVDDDEEFQKWAKKWNRIEADEKLAHIQKFLRLLL